MKKIQTLQALPKVNPIISAPAVITKSGKSTPASATVKTALTFSKVNIMAGKSAVLEIGPDNPALFRFASLKAKGYIWSENALSLCRVNTVSEKNTVRSADISPLPCATIAHDGSFIPDEPEAEMPALELPSMKFTKVLIRTTDGNEIASFEPSNSYTVSYLLNSLTGNTGFWLRLRLESGIMRFLRITGRHLSSDKSTLVLPSMDISPILID